MNRVDKFPVGPPDVGRVFVVNTALDPIPDVIADKNNVKSHVKILVRNPYKSKSRWVRSKLLSPKLLIKIKPNKINFIST